MKHPVASLTESQRERIIEAAERFFPRVLIAGWAAVELYANGGHWRHSSALMVMGEVELHEGNLWIHASVSRPNRLPSWEDLRAVKDFFIGSERRAIQVLPPKAEHYNHHPYCMHLYSPLDHEPLPDFRDTEGRI